VLVPPDALSWRSAAKVRTCASSARLTGWKKIDSQNMPLEYRPRLPRMPKAAELIGLREEDEESKARKLRRGWRLNRRSGRGRNARLRDSTPART